MRTMRNSACCGAIVALLVAALPATAAEVTRDSYREAVDPICKTNSEANERILKGVRKQVKAGQLKPAAAKFAKAAQALRGTITELKAVPQPPADQSRLAKWLRFVTTEASYLDKVAGQLRAGDKVGAQETVIRLTHNANQANNTVLPFEFQHCSFEPARFT